MIKVTKKQRVNDENSTLQEKLPGFLVINAEKKEFWVWRGIWKAIKLIEN